MQSQRLPTSRLEKIANQATFALAERVARRGPGLLGELPLYLFGVQADFLTGATAQARDVARSFPSDRRPRKAELREAPFRPSLGFFTHLTVVILTVLSYIKHRMF
jgi:hypothetical protein